MLGTLILTLSLIIGQTIRVPFGLNSFTFLDLAVILLDLIALFSIRLHLKKPPVPLILAFVFITVATISLLFTPLKLSIIEYATSFAYTIRLASFLLFAWTIYSGALASFRKNIPNILLISGVALATLGILQLIFIPNLEFLLKDGWDPHYFRTASTFLDPNFVGVYFVLTLILLASQIVPIKKKLSIALFFLVYIATITTFSRSVALMFIISFLAFAFVKRSAKFFAFTFLLSLGFIAGFFVYHLTITQPRNIDRNQSAEYRLNSWQQGLKIFQSAPVLGVGFNSYRFALAEYRLTSEQFLQGRSASGNDSSLLFIASTTGILGLITYLGILISLLILSFKSYLLGNTWGIILFSALAGLAVHSFFVNSLFYPWFLTWITLASVQLKSQASKREL